MRIRPTSLLLSLLLATAALADQPMCGVSEEREEIARLHHERMERRAGGIAANATSSTSVATLREGTLFMRTDEQIASGGHLFDLEGHSLVFEPRAGNRFATRRTALQYREPEELLRDFAGRAATAPFYVTYDLSGFSVPIFGRNVTRLYLTAFNEIEFAEPRDEGTPLVDNLEAAVHRNAVLSPLMITNRKPRQLGYPRVYVDELPGRVIVTWRSTAGDTFGYDVQAELHSDGTVVYSYKSMREMKWGTPVLSAGFDPSGGTARRQLYTANAPAGVSSQFGALAGMLDIRSVEVSRMGESDLLGVRLKFAAPIDASKLADGQGVRYVVTVSNEITYLELSKSGVTVFPFGGIASAPNGATAHLSGDTIEFFFLQVPAEVTRPQMRAFTQLRPSSTADTFSWIPTLDVAPRSSGADLSALTSAAELSTPISEPFVLPVLDVVEVWERLQPAFGLSTYDYDAIAIYQNFYTDMIFYAGAYSLGGNPAVNGIAPTSQTYGLNARRHPNLLHMNHFTYNYNAANDTASQVILHEFGHRWLYFFRILENGAAANSLNPVSAHPAAYVNTPAAFPVYREGESSVMGGAVFSQEGSSWRARVSNRGYSWHDLYLMGLASREEVMPWFYLAGTGLRGDYWPDDNVVVTGEKREVALDQIIAVHGVRNPPAALSQKKFRVLFVLVTDREPTDADVTKMTQWRRNFEQTFYRATGGRAQVETEYVRASKKRAVR